MSPAQRWRIQAARDIVPNLWAVDPWHARNYVTGLWADVDVEDRLFHQRRQVAVAAQESLVALMTGENP